MFYNQPIAHRFGTAITNDIESGNWTRIEVAVAWVRRSGTKHLDRPIKEFLQTGGFAQFTVGVDIENTSAEGLSDLLDWQHHGNAETYIHHNEANTIFHPKVYLFHNELNARLIVGSNNITEAGFYLNTEAGLQIEAPINNPIIQDVKTTLAAWRDPNTHLAKKLDNIFLNDLVQQGYVLSESVLQQRRKSSIAKGSSRRKKGSQALFGSQRYGAPPVQGVPIKTRQTPGTVLLMRVRRASEHARRTQIQIPIKVINTYFFQGINSLVSAHDGRSHIISQATARGGGLNTIKAEIPEIAPMIDPVLRLERTLTAIIYQAFDGSSVLGYPIRQALLTGFRMNPATTFSSISTRSNATWWRFI
jgi:HKD family nuclease